MTKPAVSVILPIYNGERFIDETIASIVAQSFTDWELIVVNDGSTDNGPALIQAWVDKHPGRIRLAAHTDNDNHGLSATRNRGIELSSADLVAFIDADDVWPPKKLARQLALFEKHPEIGMAASAAEYWYSWAGGEDTIVEAGHRRDAVVPPGEASVHVYPLGQAQAPCPSALMVRRAVLDDVGGFEAHFTGDRQLYEDQAFLAKVYLAHAVYFDSRCQLRYRQHPDSIMASTIRDGKYEAVRKYFLDWFASYLKRSQARVPGLRMALMRARLRNTLASFRSPRTGSA